MKVYIKSVVNISDIQAKIAKKQADIDNKIANTPESIAPKPSETKLEFASPISDFVQKNNIPETKAEIDAQKANNLSALKVKAQPR